MNLMYISAEKKVLFVTATDHQLDNLMKQTHIIDPENIIVLQNDGPLITYTFDEIMRDIIITVYRENIDEIFVETSKDDKPTSNDVVSKLYESPEFKGKIQELDYLFKTCKPEILENSVSEWLEGSHEKKSNCVNIIRNHPLLPPHVQVTEV